MDIDNLKYFRKFSNLQKIIDERTEGIWVGIFVPNFQTENILIEKIKEEFTNSFFVELDLRKRPQNIKIATYIKKHLPKLKEEKVSIIVMLRGLGAILGTEKEQEFLRQLNFERDSLFSINAIVFLFALKSYMRNLRFGAGDFWDWLQYKIDFDDLQPFKNRVLEVKTNTSSIKSAEEAEENIENLLNQKEKILKQIESLSEKRRISAILNIDLQLIENYYYLAQYDKALEFAFEDIEYLQKFKDDKLLSELYEVISLIYQDKGELNKALDYQLKAYDVKRKILPENHPEFASIYNNLASIYQAKGNLNRALEYQQKAIGIVKEKLPDKQLYLATNYNNLAAIYKDNEDYEQALKYQMKALEIFKENLPENHPNFATIFNNLSLIYQAKGDLEKALDYQLKALKIREKSLPKNHPSLASSYINLSTIYYTKDDLDKALKFQQKALKILEKQLPENHPSLLTSYNNMSLIYQALAKKYKQKANLIKRTLDML